MARERRRRQDPEEQRLLVALDQAATRRHGWGIGGNVVGMGIAPKTVRGTESGPLALKVYVAKKRSRKELTRASLVPPVLELADAGEVVTDVEEIGRMRLEAFTARVRPAVPGYSVGHRRVTAGTLGALVRSVASADRGALYILSNSHVLALSGTARKGDPVLQPGPLDGGAARDRIAKLARWHPFEFGAGAANLVDAALAGPVEPDAVIPEIAAIGIPAGVNAGIGRGMTVQKSGRTTGHTTGIVKDVHYRTVLNYPRPGGGTGRVFFRDQVLCSRYTEPGDSGSLVLDEAKRAVGLHFSGSPAASVFHPIAAVLAALEVELVTASAAPGAVATAEPEDARGLAVDPIACSIALEANATRIFAIPGVVGAGVSEKTTRGRGRGSAAVVIYVERKKAPAEIPPSEFIPPLLEAPSRNPGAPPIEVPTDVVEVGPMSLE